MKSFTILLSFFLFSACQQTPPPSQAETNAEAMPIQVAQKGDPFGDYWYQGKAELTSYDLKQSRYGEIHEGEAVMIFVTEDFSKSKQVKLDNPSRNPKDKTSVLKLNFTRNFNTGIYPYSTMMSVFTPIEQQRYPNSFKVTTSSQDWCGHTFMQVNLNDKGYFVQQNSYFESEGDRSFQLSKALLEDEIWAKIRINPASLPIGKINLIPGTLFTRLKHTEFKVMDAVAKKESKDGIITYSVDYRDVPRSLRFSFKKEFPHEILSWEETGPGGFSSTAKRLTTRATRKKSIMLDYWSKNRNSDKGLRDELRLD